MRIVWNAENSLRKLLFCDTEAERTYFKQFQKHFYRAAVILPG